MLTYCMNIHPTQTYAETIKSLQGPVRQVKAGFSPDAGAMEGAVRKTVHRQGQEADVRQYVTQLCGFAFCEDGSCCLCREAQADGEIRVR